MNKKFKEEKEKYMKDLIDSITCKKGYLECWKC